MDNGLMVYFNASKAGRDRFQDNAHEGYATVTGFKGVKVACNAATGTVLYATDFIKSSDTEACRRAEAEGAVRITEIPAAKAIYFEHADAMVSRQGLIKQMTELEPAERLRVQKARNDYLPSKQEGWIHVPKLGRRGMYPEPGRLAF